MTTKEIYNTIAEAIKEKTELLLTIKHGAGSTIADTLFQAYILGDDTYQYGFVWGYLPSKKIYYKFLLGTIVSAKKTSNKYSVRVDACYQHANGEDHFGIIAGFDNIYDQAAQHATK